MSDVAGGGPRKYPARSRSEILNLLKREAVRLKTFRTWPLQFGYLLPRDLAKAGFFYFNDDCAVQCAFCLGIIRDWTPADNPVNEHRRRFWKTCRFIIGMPVGNVRLDPRTGREEELVNVQGPVEGGRKNPYGDSDYDSMSSVSSDESSSDDDNNANDDQDGCYTLKRVD